MAIEAGQARLEVLDEAAREALGLGERQLAELGARARHRAAPERRGVEREPDRLGLGGERFRAGARHVEHDQVLHRRGADLAGAEALGQVGDRPHLRRA